LLFEVEIRQDQTIRIQGWFQPTLTNNMNEQVEQIEDQVVTFDVDSIPVQPSIQTEEKVLIEELKVSGDSLVAKLKELLRQGNIRRLIIKNSSGRTLVEIPLSIGVVGGVLSAVFFPAAVAIAAVAALAAPLTIVIARKV